MARPAGRPRSEDPRTEIERFRVTPGEKARIAERALAAGLKVPEFLRRRALGIRINGIPERTSTPKGGVARVVGRKAIEREEVAAEVAEARMPTDEAREAFLERRSRQRMGEFGETSPVAHARAMAEWNTRGTASV